MKSKKISSQPKSDQDIFDNLSGEWWDENGGFAALHTFNPLRISYILNVLGKPIKNLKVLDIGCLEINRHRSTSVPMLTSSLDIGSDEEQHR